MILESTEKSLELFRREIPSLMRIVIGSEGELISGFVGKDRWRGAQQQRTKKPPQRIQRPVHPVPVRLELTPVHPWTIFAIANCTPIDCLRTSPKACSTGAVSELLMRYGRQ
jgi:hypothetical protein